MFGESQKQKVQLKKKAPEIIKITAPKRKLKPKRKENLQEIGWKIEIQK